ncbi:MAG: glutamate formimidoyltransferase [Gammaproteobacteria bacterium]|nr:glutamate formimidoyltransferase [Gammaproteobacteria bacterium]
MKLIECIPNFSEGRDRRVIDAIAAVIDAVDGVTLLDVDPGAATNRTVMTFAGSPEAVEEAAFLAIEKAADLIDMRTHHGEHPRMGSTDVCPFVPLDGASMEDCVRIARRLGERVGTELSIPVYLYGEAATRSEHRSLADVRRGEYEGLADREDEPDFGPTGFNARTGATAIGARNFLIAYNVNLNTRDRRLANKIAGALRESGRPKRGPDGKIQRDANGVVLREPGRFTHLRGVGWYIEEYGRAQVSFNLTDPDVTSLHAVFDAACDEAAQLGVRVTGSEIVGLVPRRAMLAAGDHYLHAQGKTTGIPEAERMHIAVLSLGLNDVTPFDPADKVIEYRYHGAPSGLVTNSLWEFADILSAGTPTPGGGSVAALVGSLSVALTSMVAALTFSKTSDTKMEDIGRSAQQLKYWFLDAVDRDTDSFNALMAALRLPRKTDAERLARDHAVQDATVAASLVPLEVLEHCVDALDAAMVVAKDGNESAVTDTGVAASCALAAAEGASLNVRINLGSLLDHPETERLDARRSAALESARTLAADVLAIVESRIANDH